MAQIISKNHKVIIQGLTLLISGSDNWR